MIVIRISLEAISLRFFQLIVIIYSINTACGDFHFVCLILSLYLFVFFCISIAGCFSDDQNCDSLCHFTGPESNFCKCTQSSSISSKYITTIILKTYIKNLLVILSSSLKLLTKLTEWKKITYFSLFVYVLFAINKQSKNNFLQKILKIAISI